MFSLAMPVIYSHLLFVKIAPAGDPLDSARHDVDSLQDYHTLLAYRTNIFFNLAAQVCELCIKGLRV